MKKFLFCSMLLFLVWLCKLSYDIFQISQQLPAIVSSLHQGEQRNASLNDQVVALQRQFEQVTGAATPPMSAISQAPTGTAQTDPLPLLRQRLELVQFALQQQQYMYALEKLNQLDQSLAQDMLAPELKQGLHQAIQKDQLEIQQFVQAKERQQEALNTVMVEIDQRLSQALQNTQLSPARTQQQHFWQRWLQIEPLQRADPQLMNRQLILKEIQLRLLLARQSLQYGQYAQYQQSIESIIRQLEQLPDHASQQLKQRLSKLKYLPVIPAPKLNSMALLG